MKIVLFTLALMAALVCNAQQDPQYSQYMFNMVNVNPGYAGSRNVLSLVGIHRSQWANKVEGAPTTTSLTADMPALRKKAGIGFSVVNDRIGRFNNNMVNVFAAYRLKTDQKGTLGLGLSAGVSLFRAELSSIRSNPQGTSESLFQDYSKTAPAVGAGFFYNRDKWYLGLSAPNLLRTSEGLYTKDNGVFRRFQHLFLMGGYVIDFSDAVKLKPSFMLKGTTGAPVALDLNANVWLHDVVALGVSYRIKNAVIPMIEIQATPQLRFGYAMDYTISDFKNEVGNTPITHEILLRYEFGFQEKKVLSPRYF